MTQSLTYPSLALDTVQFDETRSLAGDKFPLLLGFFLEDASLYLDQLRASVRASEAETTARLAHTLKSSAKQFGFLTMTEPARQLEEAARRTVGTPDRLHLASAEDAILLAPLAAALDEAYAQTRPVLQHYLGQWPAAG